MKTIGRASGKSRPQGEETISRREIRPEISDRRFPVAAKTSNRPEHPRASTIPAPPTIAPDHDPVIAIIRASAARNSPSSSARCTQTTAVEKVSSQTENLRSQSAAGEFDRRRAQTERRPLGGDPKHHAGDKAEQGAETPFLQNRAETSGP